MPPDWEVEMKKAILRTKPGCYYFVNSERIEGVHTRLSGDMTCLSGNVTGLYGNVDDCEISDEERKNGIDISDLIPP